MGIVGLRNIEFWPRNILWGGQIYLPYHLLLEPVSGNFFRDPGRSGKLLDGSNPLPVASRAVVDILKLFVTHCLTTSAKNLLVFLIGDVRSRDPFNVFCQRIKLMA